MNNAKRIDANRLEPDQVRAILERQQDDLKAATVEAARAIHRVYVKAYGQLAGPAAMGALLRECDRLAKEVSDREGNRLDG